MILDFFKEHKNCHLKPHIIHSKSYSLSNSPSRNKHFSFTQHTSGTSGTRMGREGHDWDATGTRLRVGHGWDTSGTRVGHEWDASGARVGHDWDTTGTRLGHDWDAGTEMGPLMLMSLSCPLSSDAFLTRILPRHTTLFLSPKPCPLSMILFGHYFGRDKKPTFLPQQMARSKKKRF